MIALSLLLTTPGIAKEKKIKNKSALEAVKPLHDKVTGQGYGAAGCGLGSVLFGDKPGMIQVIAVTTNGTLGNQTFGISSGTLNCDEDGDDDMAALENRVGHLVLANRNRIESEVVQGAGESIAALANLGKCGNSAHLGKNLQNNYAAVFSQNSDHKAIAAKIIPVMKNSDCQI